MSEVKRPYSTILTRCLSSLVGKTVNFGPTGPGFETTLPYLGTNIGFLPSPRNEEIREVVSPGSVKEKAHLINKMASETDLSQKQPYVSGRRREHRDEKTGDDDACSISTLDPRRKEWILKASHADYHELVRLLREEPKYARAENATITGWADGLRSVIIFPSAAKKWSPVKEWQSAYVVI
ncbi:uncharacterized protein NPIL_444142 [Nephila pilipes]|uniref:Uncharacterized protein n=1 Tax=Nephila pilipes TaxID=299642 RepID=A0A8X6PCB8_NEPPI|nr:uncharacterized protein NPIL_444142 [Nephila pilipes]